MVKVDIKKNQIRNLHTTTKTTKDTSQTKVEKTNKKMEATRRRFWYYWSDYCASSSIHGMHYLSQNRTVVEYIFWILLLLLSILGSILMIYNLIQEWVQKPVIVSFATLQQPIFEAPFPAVTVCPMNKYDKTSFTIDAINKIELNKTEFCKKRYDEDIDKEVLSEEECYNEIMKYGDIAGMLCDLQPIEWMRSDKPSVNPSDNLTEEEFTSFLQKHRLKIGRSDSSILGHDMTRQRKDFLDIFKETYTEFGLCYTYNRLRLDEIYRTDVVFLPRDMDSDIPNSEWDPDVGYDSSAGINTYPRRALKADIVNNLELNIFEEGYNFDEYCQQYQQGYVVILHYPNRLPMKKDDYFFIPLNKQIFVNIRATKMETSEKVSHYPPEKRDCYFSFERYLKYFRNYTLSNCQLECLTNVTLAHCNCVEYFMPRDNETKICGLHQSMWCVQKYAGELARLKVKISDDRRSSLLQTECNCLPLCTDVTYSAQIQEVLTEDPSFAFQKFLKDKLNETIQVSQAIFRITNDHMITTERNELYGPMDLIANIGGILGLFTGFSIISFVEIIYYLSLRLIGNIQRHGHWTGERFPADIQ